MSNRIPINITEEITLFESPTNLIITSFPKSGKTLSLINVPKILIADTEMGSKYFKARNVVHIENSNKFEVLKNGGYIPIGIYETVLELSKLNDMTTYWKLYNEFDFCIDIEKKKEIKKEIHKLINEMPYPIFVIDSITSIQDLNEMGALKMYNDEVSIEKRKKDIKRVDNYGGVRYIRTNFKHLKSFIEKAAPFIIWNGHIGEKKKILEKGEQEISVADIALSGIQGITFTSKSDANCILYRDSKGVYLDFIKREETDLGSRVAHLTEKKIKIAEILTAEELQAGNTPITYWEEIYKDLITIKK